MLIAFAVSFDACAATAAPFARMSDLPTGASRSSSAAWIDYDGNGRADLLVVNGGPDQAGSLSLYRNRGDGTFESLTNKAGGILQESAAWSSLAVADLNNDGFPEVIATVGSGGRPDFARLFVNHSDGVLESIAAGELTAKLSASQVAPAIDVNGDGLLDLVLFAPTAGDGAAGDQLLMNQGDGTFTKASQDPFAGWHNPWAVVPVDFDRDGVVDLFLVNASDGVRRSDQLLRGDGRGHFTVVADVPIVQASGETRFAAFGDFDNNGEMDAVVVKQGGQPYLYLNHGGVFAADPVRLDAPAGKPVALDYDGDGNLDLLIVGDGTPTGTARTLLRNQGGAGFSAVPDAFGGDSGTWVDAAVCDYDNDGAPDLYLVAADGKGALYRNTVGTAHWLKIAALGAAWNRTGVGLTIQVRATIGGRSVAQVR